MRVRQGFTPGGTALIRTRSVCESLGPETSPGLAKVHRLLPAHGTILG